VGGHGIGYAAVVRLSAVVDTVHGLGVSDHIGWVFEGPADFRVQAGRFLGAGQPIFRLYASAAPGVGVVYEAVTG
jgi:hypothetical protein